MPHPGDILQKQFMDPHGLSQYRVAVDIGVPPRRINEIVHGQRGITADTALRLARYFGNSAQWWMERQAEWELERALNRLGEDLTSAVKVFDPEKPLPRRGRPVRAAAPPNPPPPDPSKERSDHGHLFFD